MNSINNNNQVKLLDNDLININNIIRIILRRKKYVISFGSITFLLGFLFIAYNRIINPVYKGSFTILISDPMSIGNNRSRSSEDIQLFEELATNTTNNDIPTLIEYLKSPLILNSLAEKYNYKSRGLSEKIQIRTLGDTKRFFERANGILKVELFTKTPKKDIKLLKDLSNTYLQTSLNQRQQKLKDGLEFLDKQEPILQTKYNDLQSELVSFREKYELIEPKTEGLSLKEQQQYLKDKLLNLSSEKNKLLLVKEEIIEGTISAIGFEEKISSNNNDGLKIKDYDQSLLKQILSFENEISEKKMIFKDKSKIIQKLQKKLNDLKPALRNSQLQAVDTALKLNSAKVEDFEKKLFDLDNTFLKKPSLIKEFNSLQQKLTIAEKNLIGLVSARENFQLKIAQSSVPWKIIQEPFIGKSPIKPSVKRGLFSALLASIVFGILAALLRDKTDYVFHDVLEIKEYTDDPVLGSIPNIEVFGNLFKKEATILEKLNLKNLDLNKEEMKKYSRQRFLCLESFRNLYSSIRFLSTDKKIRIITNTSSLSSEGKTLINILLAKTMAELGQKVLLIDADLRKPQIHKRLGLNNLMGLSNFLIEPNFDYNQIIQEIKDFNNLSVITSGTIVPDPARLLSSDKMKSFLEELSKSDKYDYVLIDSPPILGLSDSVLNAEFIDGYILIITIDKIQRNLALESINRVKSSKAPLLGIVTNQINKSENKGLNNGKYGYGYGYGYGYKYGYGYGGYEYAVSESYFKDDATIENKLDDEKNQYTNKLNKNLKEILENLKEKSKKLLKWLDN